MQKTKVKEVMSGTPIFANPSDSLKDAATKMKENDCGFLPVGSKDRIEGAITDRDIVIRSVADGADPAQVKVADVMTRLSLRCGLNDTLAEAARKMRENRVSRLLVEDDLGTVKGILTFGHILRQHSDEDEIAEVVGCAMGRRMPEAGIAGSLF
jgi:CBS domain-containing protein